MNVKQVIVMRNDLNMRKGKMIAQGAHASMAVILNEVYTARNDQVVALSANWEKGNPFHTWLAGNFTKICVKIDSLDELLELKKKADEAGIPNSLIVDSGLTEFNGVPTETCMAIGPAESNVIDKLTGHLKLL